MVYGKSSAQKMVNHFSKLEKPIPKTEGRVYNEELQVASLVRFPQEHCVKGHDPFKENLTWGLSKNKSELAAEETGVLGTHY